MEKLGEIEKTLGISKSDIFSVDQITDYISEKLTKDSNLRKIYVLGEITNFSRPKSGHIYFDIKGEESKISCVLFRRENINLDFELEDGLEVIVLASVGVYGAKGQYQLIVSTAYSIGEGIYFLKFKKLKEKLSKEGLFDDEYKKLIPSFPRCVGVITSKTGAAIRDIIEVITKRFPNTNIKVCPTIVQGENAAMEIIETIEIMNKVKDIDVIILARGGGSIEDLMCFNDEELVRCIFRSNKPIVSAIGHETDYTIADFVSDKRVPTPSVAGKIVVPEKKELIEKLDKLKSDLEKTYKNYLDARKKEKELIKREREIRMYKYVVVVVISVLILLIAAYLVIK